MRPLIGVTPLHNPKRNSVWLHPDYFAALEAAGALPVLLPLAEEERTLPELARRLDGLLLSGGHDVDPELYGEELLPCCGPLSPVKDRAERALLEEFLKLDKPVYGICRGLQLINVHFGGTLWQDLPTQRPTPVCHSQQPPYDLPVHAVTVEPGTLLHRITGWDRLAVNSYHHQAVKDTAPGLTVQARSDDGLVEGLSLPSARFLLATQWHPENLYREQKPAADILKAFVRACGAAD